jgi:membrane associated rhomboid family serine protease
MASFGDRSGYGGLNMFPPVIKWLLGLNAAVFILGMLPGGTYDGTRVMLEDLFRYYGGLWPIGSEPFMLWQYFTYMFLHGDLAHIFLNMLGLWMFGMELESIWGSKRFLVFYLLCGIGAGVIHTLVTMLIPGDRIVPTVGASGAIYGVMVAFAMIFPDRIIFAMFIPMKAKYAILFFTVLSLFNGIGRTGDNIAHFAHLGGALVGFLMIQIGGKMTLGGIFDRFGRLPKGNATPAPRPRSVGEPAAGRVIDVEFREVRRQQNPQEMNFGDAQERVDAILDKISRLGYQNLTAEEKAILLDASRKMK